jgi:hypothetical protein
MGSICWENAFQQHTLQYCILWAQEVKEEQGLLIQQKKITDAAGNEPVTSW